MNKKIFIIITAIFMMTIYIYADKTDELNNVNSQLNDIKGKINQKNQNISELNKSILLLDNDILTVQNKLSQTQVQLDEKQKQIDENIKKIEIKKQEILKLTYDLKNRIRVMSKVKDIDYIEIILSSKSIKEIFANYNIMKRVVKQDKQGLDNLEKAKKKLQEIYKKLDSDKKKIEILKTDYIAQSRTLESAKIVQQKNIDALKNDLKSLEEIENIKRLEADNLAEEIRLLTQKSNIQNNQSDSNSNTTQNSSASLSYPVAVANITSVYGYRHHPILNKKMFHTGVDFAGSTGTPILAAGSGTVIYAGPKGTYGNAVMIQHTDNMVSLYAHCFVVNVRVGEKVSKGQVIAKIGSTGRSTGPHLHFEVRINGNYYDPMKFLNY